MKLNRWLHALCASCCWMMILSSFGSAQNQLRHGTVNIPFEFYVAGDKLPAGQYTLEIIAPTYVLLQSPGGKLERTLYFLQTATAAKDIKPRIRFAMREEKYYFAEVWSWYGKAQLTSFVWRDGEQVKDVPLQAAGEGQAGATPDR